MVELQVVGPHHEVLALTACVRHLHPAHGPAEFGRYDITAGYPNIRALTQSLDAVHLRAVYLNIFRIPDGGTAELCHLAAFYLQSVIVPERITQIEITVSRNDVTTFLECALAVCRSVKAASYRLYLRASVERSLLIECSVFYLLHIT